MLDAPFVMLGSWLIGCSVASFCLMGLDKYAARAQLPRTSEATFLKLAAVGGWPGTLAAMLVFRHKRKKASFKWRCALAILLNASMVWLAIVLLES